MNRARDCLSLHQVRTAVAATSVDGRHAVGGECEQLSRGNTLSSVEYYDPIQNSWAYVAEMKQPRSFAAVAVLDGKPALSLSLSPLIDHVVLLIQLPVHYVFTLDTHCSLGYCFDLL